MNIQRVAIALIGISSLLALGALLHDQPAEARGPSVLRAKAIEIVDGRGRVRAQLAISPDGEVVFRLRDASGAIRAKLGASEDGSALVLLNEATEVGAHLLASRDRTLLTLQRGDRRQDLVP